MTSAAEEALLDHCNDANVMWEGNFREFNAMLTRLIVLSFTEETRRKIKITLEQVKAEIERHRIELERGRRSESAEEEPSPAHAPADKGEFPLLSELLGVKLEDIPHCDRPWLEYVVSTCRNRNFKSQKQLSDHLYGNDGKDHNGTLSKQLKAANLKFWNGRIVSRQA
ncbi:MAG: hypothetical protein K6F50_09625 [Kiritimatiellae bacterium]|nr:hypothetical protein [Kiritimatiellia bacterium]